MDVENFCVFYMLYNILDFLYIFFSHTLMTHLASCYLVFKYLPPSGPIMASSFRLYKVFSFVFVAYWVSFGVFFFFFSDSKSVFVKMKGAGVGCAEGKLVGWMFSCVFRTYKPLCPLHQLFQTLPASSWLPSLWAHNTERWGPICHLVLICLCSAVTL